jgi:hypothetical protein
VKPPTVTGNLEGRERPARWTMKKTRRKELTGQDIDAMSDAEKTKLIAGIEAKTPEQRRAESEPLNPAEQARWDRFRKKAQGGRPKI